VQGIGDFPQDLVLNYGSGDQLVIDDFFGSYYYQVEQIKFSDGVVWELADITDRVVMVGTELDDYLPSYLGSSRSRISGLGGNDSILGGFVNDRLDGGSGNDTLFGNTGDDTLVGGSGTDYLNGGEGDDTYVISSTSFDIDDSAGNDTAIVSVSFAKLPSYIENVVYVDGAQALPYWIDALLSDDAAGNGYQRLMGASNTINYAYPEELPSYDTYSEDAFLFSGFNAAQKAFSKQALVYISTVLDLKFVEVSDPAAINTISFGNNYQFYSSAYAYLPSSSFLSRDLFLDIATPGNLSPEDGDVSALILIHELGHTLGLEHPFAEGSDAPHLTGTEDSTQWTVMSYTDSPDQYHLQYSELDIAALQYLYGPSSKARTGNDVYVVNALTTNFVWDGAGVDILDASAQTQAVTLYLDAGYWGFVGSKASKITAAGQVTVNFGSVIENLSGGSGGDALYGNAAGNIIKGGAGNDTITGNAGNDTLNGGTGNDSLVGGAGMDTASYADSTGAIVATLSGAANATGADGTDVLSGMENLIGSSYADNLTGSTAANRLEGGAGNDSLNGGAGADTLLGGAGDDQYSVDNIGDIVTENASEGTDTVLSSVSFVLGANVENLRLTAATAINGTGNNLDNLIIAGAGDNILDGSTGIDTVSYASSGAAVIASLTTKVATGGSGSDSLLNFENLIGSNYADSLTGSSTANRLEGAGGNDTLNGASGADTLLGGTGNDQYTVDNAGDVVTENTDAGLDTVYANISYSLTANVENLRLTGTNHINATGNELNNPLFASTGNNILNGASGTDTASYANTSGGVTVSLATETAQTTGNSGTDTLTTIHQIQTAASEEKIISSSSEQLVITLATVQHIICISSKNDVISAITQTRNPASGEISIQIIIRLGTYRNNAIDNVLHIPYDTIAKNIILYPGCMGEEKILDDQLVSLPIIQNQIRRKATDTQY
jgi:Ca2+-binding RTX toxin-like protein